MISLELEKICETLIELKKLSVVKEARTHTEKSSARIAVSQDLRTLNADFVAMSYTLSLMRCASKAFSVRLANMRSA